MRLAFAFGMVIQFFQPTVVIMEENTIHGVFQIKENVDSMELGL
jgi:hypothetical protein